MGRSRFVVVLFPLVTLAGIFSPASAQQSLFNVPAGLSTAEGQVFGQEQLTFTGEDGESNSTVEIGVTKWLELGFNVFHVPLYHRGEHAQPAGAGPPLATAFTGNLSTSLHLTDSLRVFFGGALGFGHSPLGDKDLVGMGWALTRWDAPGRWGSYVVGAYAGNAGALGKGSPAGGLVGVEIPIIPELLSFLGDWIIGDNDISVAVLGLVAFFGPSFQLCAGAQLPSPGSGNGFGGVVEFTWVPVDRDRPAVHTR